MFRSLTIACGFAAAIALGQRPSIAAEPVASLEWIRVSDDGTHFVTAQTRKRFIIWGVNYDRDDGGRLLEDYWGQEWDTVVEDFGEIKQLGANVVRVHLQLARFMKSATEPNAENLAQLAKLVRLAEEKGLYLDVTGLGCYHKQDVPQWYDALEEAARWEVQARFWEAVAKTCRESPAIFCYDLMNEPVFGGDKKEESWLAKPLGDKYYVQRINLESKGRTRVEVAQAWVKKLTDAIRRIDDRHLITVGVIPWAQIFKGAKPVFYAPDVGKPLDFVSVHFYPKKNAIEESLAAIKVYEVGKPLVIEEMFPMHCSLEEMKAFIDGSRTHTDGWVSFYWGRTIEEYEKAGDLKSALIANWLRSFREQSPFLSK